MAGWRVDQVERLSIARRNRLADMYMLSPFVWRDGALFRMLARAVPRRDDEPRLKIAEIWHGTSEDGLHFEMDVAPLIFPGPELADIDGCEDPTVRCDDGVLRVWYTGYHDQEKVGRLLLARGPDVARVSKAGVAIDSAPPFANPKEATVAPLADRWRVWFEYAHDDASLIGQADAADPDGPWTELTQAPLLPRPDCWDAWHLSPGPLVGEGTAAPVMFYNGATRDAQWRIGWAQFDRPLGKVTARGDTPLVCPDAQLGEGATDIAFAASAVEQGDAVWLYFSQSDQDLRRATLKRE